MAHIATHPGRPSRAWMAIAFVAVVSLAACGGNADRGIGRNDDTVRGVPGGISRGRGSVAIGRGRGGAVRDRPPAIHGRGGRHPLQRRGRRARRRR